MIMGLGYAGFGSDRLDDWRQFGTNLLGFQAVERGNSLLAFRMDDRKQRVVIDRAIGEGARFFGWEVADAAALRWRPLTMKVEKIAPATFFLEGGPPTTERAGNGAHGHK